MLTAEKIPAALPAIKRPGEGKISPCPEGLIYPALLEAS